MFRLHDRGVCLVNGSGCAALAHPGSAPGPALQPPVRFQIVVCREDGRPAERQDLGESPLGWHAGSRNDEPLFYRTLERGRQPSVQRAFRESPVSQLLR